MGQFIGSNFILLGVITILLAIGMMLIVRKILGLEFLRDHHPVSDPLLACVGTLFAILLGFMVANAMTRFEEARTNVEQEAGAVGDIYRLSRSLPDTYGNQIRSDCFSYLDGVIDIEWNDMSHRKMSYDVWNRYGAIWTDCLSVEPATNRETNIHATLLNAMTTLGDCRRIRATQMNNSVPTVLWAVVLIGATATGILVLFFGISNMVVQTFKTALVTLVLYLNVFLLACYDDPFGGEVSIKPHAFEVLRTSLNRRFSNQYVDEKLLQHRSESDPADNNASDDSGGSTDSDGDNNQSADEKGNVQNRK